MVSESEYQQMLDAVNGKKSEAGKKAKASKFSAKKTVVDNITFDSKKEAERYGKLKMLQSGGKISNLKVHVPYSLSVNDLLICKYEADFVYIIEGKEIVEDVKGYKKGTAYGIFTLKKKLMKAIYGIEILES